MRLMCAAFPVASAVAFAIATYALVRGDIDILIIGFALTLMFMLMTRKPPHHISIAGRVRQEPSLPMQLPLPSSIPTPTENPSDHVKMRVTFPKLTIEAADCDDENDVKLEAMLIDTKTPMLVVIHECDGPVHTLVYPNVRTRLLSCDDLKDCA